MSQAPPPPPPPPPPSPPPPSGYPTPGPPAGGPSGPRADFGTRFLAILIDAVIVWIVTAIAFRINLVLGLLLALASIAYYVYFEGSPSGQTVGKRAMKIRVVDAQTGSSIDRGRALVRNLMRIVSGIPCYLGYLWMLWDPEKQTWHDKVAATYVVPTSAYPVESWPG